MNSSPRSTQQRFLKTASCLAFFFAVAVFPGLQLPVCGAPPNFVVILADDMGFSDAGCYGGEIQTPNLDRLASNGLRYTQFYSTARCWPTRASILCGYYPQQVGRDNLPGLGGGASGVRPAWARLLPELLRPLGYRSYHSGKWHVDGPVLAGGFDHSYCLEDHNRHFYPRQHLLDDRPLPAVKPGDGYYTSTAIAQHAIEMLREHQASHAKQPFLLYLAFTAPHFPLQAIPEDIALYTNRYLAGWDVLRKERHERLSQLGLTRNALPALETTNAAHWSLSETKLQEQIDPGESGHAVPWNSLSASQKRFQPLKMAVHAAMVHRMDIEIGRVLEELRRAEAYENTVILFASDNGASAEQIIRGDMHDRSAPAGSGPTFLCLGAGWSSAANTPFRLHKSWVHEGGISSPLIIHWPAGISARGELRHSPGHVIDVPVTLLDLAGGQWPKVFKGAPVPPSPGRSLAPTFNEDVTVQHDSLWWFHDGNRAIRSGNWKLVADHKNPWELYHLGRDRAESVDLIASEPDRARELGIQWTNKLNEFIALRRASMPARADNPSAPARKRAGAMTH